jgi:HSP20 family molecular chaperone IbpA
MICIEVKAMWEDWERLMKQVARTSQQFVKALDDFRGPEPYIRVHDQDRQVKVVINPLPEQKVRRWAVRVSDDRLFIRGFYTVEVSVSDDRGSLHQEKRSDEFVKAVRLPGPVESKPASYRKEGETLILTFSKKKEISDGWFDLQN